MKITTALLGLFTFLLVGFASQSQNIGVGIGAGLLGIAFAISDKD